MNVSPELRSALIRIRNQPELKPFLVYLDDMIKEATNAMVALNDDAAIHRAQGAVRRLSALRDFIVESNRLPDEKERGVATAHF